VINHSFFTINVLGGEEIVGKRNKKEKKKPQKPKVDLMAGMPRPKPITLHGPRYFIETAREYPIMGCWVMKGWQNSGLTPVIVARQQSPDKVIFGSFLVDLYCLGVKDVYSNGDFLLKRFQGNLPKMCMGEPELCDVGFAHELIYGAIDYARRYGFEPHPDFKPSSQILDPPGTHPLKKKINFGRDGKPFFVAGPHDNVKAIIAKLNQTAGEGNYNYMIGFGGHKE
jgi:hypothetical protein